MSKSKEKLSEKIEIRQIKINTQISKIEVKAGKNSGCIFYGTPIHLLKLIRAHLDSVIAFKESKEVSKWAKTN